MALPRPTWKGYLKLVLVSCPIAVYSAVSSTEKVRFNQINRKTGNRIRQRMVDEGTDETVEASDKIRGYEVDRDVYVTFEDDELDAVAIESSQTVDIDVFVPRDQIDNRYLESPYYIAPTGKVGSEAFTTIRDVMKLKRLVALGRVVMARRERVIMLQPWDKGMVGTTLRYPYEIRDVHAYFDDIEEATIGEDLMAMAMQIVDARRADFDPSKFRDRYEDALIEIIERKKAGLPPEARRPISAGGGVVDFMEALKRSLVESGKQTKSMKAPAKAKGKQRIEGQREMLLPIPGKKPEAAKQEKKPLLASRRKAR